MKKLFVVLLTLCTLAAFAACSGQTAAGLSEADLMLTVDGETFDCETNITQVIAALGDGYGYAEGRSCAYDGLDKTYAYDAATFYTNPLSEGDMVTEIYTESPEVSTSKGLTVGASREDVLAAYGEPSEDDGYTLIYRVSQQPGEPSLCFDLEGNTIFAIFLTRGLI